MTVDDGLYVFTIGRDRVIECRCMRDDCASCVERYRLAALDLDRGLRPGGRLRLKLRRIRELVQKIEKRRGRG